MKSYLRLCALSWGFLAALSGCTDRYLDPPLEPYSVWCPASPYPISMFFEEDAVVSSSEDERVIQARLSIPIDSFGLTDEYVMQFRHSRMYDGNTFGTLGVTTDWIERAPMPAQIDAAWDLNPLFIQLDDLFFDIDNLNSRAKYICDDIYGEDCRYWHYTGTCSYGSETTEFVAHQFFEAEAECATAQGKPAMFVAALSLIAVLARRRRGVVSARLTLLAVIGLLLPGCKESPGTWVGAFGNEARLRIGIANKSDQIDPWGNIWLASRPNDVFNFTCPDWAFEGSSQVVANTCEGMWYQDGDFGLFSFDIDIIEDYKVTYMGGWGRTDMFDDDGMIMLMRVTEPPTGSAEIPFPNNYSPDLGDSGFGDSGFCDNGLGDSGAGD